MKKILIALLLILSFSTIVEAATLSDVRTRVRELLYETDEVNSIYTNTLINEAINEAQYMQQSIFNYAGYSKVAEDYRAFIEEFLQDIK